MPRWVMAKRLSLSLLDMSSVYRSTAAAVLNVNGVLELNFFAIFVQMRTLVSKLYIPSTLNNSNRAYTFICLGRAGRFGQC